MNDGDQPHATAIGNATIDAIIDGLIGIYEAVFPERIRGYYLTGSYAAGG